jgi:hypothetical protein
MIGSHEERHGREMSIAKWRRPALTLGGSALVVASIVQFARSRCQAGTFAYMIPVETRPARRIGVKT